MSRLSALQIAQLADAASQLAGGRSTSLFEGLRSHLGIDDLDITTDARGRAQVSAGKYLNERTYIELQQGGDNSSKAIINFDVGRGVKLRGAAELEWRRRSWYCLRAGILAHVSRRRAPVSGDRVPFRSRLRSRSWWSSGECSSPSC